ncbi:uncharacterized protein EI90DRAFT_968198 [Cantharellus anzutake]|uniref:uncharacterized protein n=1 Tax=Cantharellus anzutake TaxID=1750568 RepID=UPI0019034EA8|nr:uncharacterized protein EI90DRAFT_968198 [Cantharellus anzutake]KAF8311431.1 hypothetical protein EI90DRAFT_968198 [Cantharellus anzutake]
MAEFHGDPNKFKLALRDFLVQLKEFSGDNADLFIDEKEAEANSKLRLSFKPHHESLACLSLRRSGQKTKIYEMDDQAPPFTPHPVP